MNKTIGLLVGIGTLALAASASAQTFDMTWSNSVTGTANIVLTTTSVGEPAGEYLITGASGTLSNIGTVTGVQYTDGADNILYMNQGNLYASYGGTTFMTPGDWLNIFSANGVLNEQTSEQTSNSNSSTVLNNVSVQAVPEPSSYAMFGIGAIGLVLRRRKK